MKNKLFFRILRFIKKLGLQPTDITLDTSDTDGMSALAVKIMSALFNLEGLETEYYEITMQLFGCDQEEAEDKEIFEVILKIASSLKGNTNFSIGALGNTK